MVTRQLQGVDYKSTNTYYHNFTYCKCVKVYDGDTITVATMMNHGAVLPVAYRFAVRIMGIDAPEMKGDTIAEKNLAVTARDALTAKILGKIIRLEILEQPEKWGRILANVYIDGENIAEWMLKNKFAIPYSGKTKVKPAEWQ
jgi:endonuclease YncB( thermonuclease family)